MPNKYHKTVILIFKMKKIDAKCQKLEVSWFIVLVSYIERATREDLNYMIRELLFLNCSVFCENETRCTLSKNGLILDFSATKNIFHYKHQYKPRNRNLEQSLCIWSKAT